MLLISLQFGVFFLALLLLYYIFPTKSRWFVLLAGSAAFYILAAKPYTALYLLCSIVTVYFSAIYISNAKALHKKAVMLVAICANVALLVSLRYLNGFLSAAGTASRLLGKPVELPFIKWIVPLGIGFYTLQLLGYLTDVYRGISPAQKNPAKLALFASYFPSLSSGPILRYSQVENELFVGHKAEYRNITFGMQRMLWGLLKKIVIAERLAPVVNAILTDTNTYGGLWVWIGLFTGVFWVYADFSGNMDFIIGVSECFGVRLPDNFRQPFLSLTIQEFWQRWHITLGLWLKDYIMFPILRTKAWQRLGKLTKKHLGKKAAKLIPMFLAMLVLWIANGIWHGGYPKYMMTALWFWFAIMSGQLIEPIGSKISKLLKINTSCLCWKTLQRIRTVIVCGIGTLFFCAPGIANVFEMFQSVLSFRHTFGLSGNISTFFHDAFILFGEKTGLFALTFSIILLIVIETYQNNGGKVREWLAARNLPLRWFILLGIIFFVLLFGAYGPGYHASEFIYAGF